MWEVPAVRGTSHVGGPLQTIPPPPEGERSPRAFRSKWPGVEACFMSHAAQRVYVFRHGATEWSAAGRHTGRTDVPLTREGRRNAERLRPLLRGRSFARVMTSPLQRAVQTCQLAGLADGAQRVDELKEWDYGDYEGLTSDEIHRERPGWLVFTDGCPNGESPAQVGRRVDRVIDEVRRVEGDVALFAHGHVLRVLAARWLRLPAGDGRFFVLDTATYSLLGDYHHNPALLCWNASLELDGSAV